MPQQLANFKAEFFKALGHPVRIRILDCLRGGEKGVNELSETLKMEQANVFSAIGNPPHSESGYRKEGWRQRVLFCFGSRGLQVAGRREGEFSATISRGARHVARKTARRRSHNFLSTRY